MNLRDLKELYPALREKLWKPLYNLTGNAQDTEDILQEAFIKSFAYIREGKVAEQNLPGLLYRLAYNAYLKQHNIEKRREELAGAQNWEESAGNETEKSFIRNKLHMFFLNALESERLSEKRKSILSLRYLKKKTVKEIARELNLSERQIYREINGIHKVLREEYIAAGLTLEDLEL